MYGHQWPPMKSPPLWHATSRDLFFWPRDIIKGNPRSYSFFETYFDLYPTGSPLLMVHWCGPSDWPTVPPIRSHLYWPMKSSFTLFLWKYIEKSDHQPITKWIIYYLFFRHATPLLFLPNDKTIWKIIISNLYLRYDFWNRKWFWILGLK